MLRTVPARKQLFIAALLAAFAFACAFAPGSDAAVLKPPPGKVFFGVTDTGEVSDFRDFARAVKKRPAVIQTFHPWDNSWSKSLPRWRALRARPMVHVTTRADDGTELITPRQIARGRSDDYLVAINRTTSKRNLRLYLRPLGEPNRCLNLYAGVDCSGNIRGGDYAFKWYRSAFRRIAIITRGGGRLGTINRRLQAVGLPKVQNTGTAKRLPRRLPRAPISIVWSPLPAGSPTVPQNRPAHYWPGKKWVDWVATDFYNRYNNWRHLDAFYKNWALGQNKPMALSEFALWGSDGPGFIRRLFTFARKRPKVRMMVYYQDFGTSNSFRIQNFPKGRQMLSQFVRGSKFPKFAPGYPRFR